MRKTSPALPSEKECRKCNQVRPMLSLHTVVLTYVCSPCGRKATVMSCNAARDHCSCHLLLDKVMNVRQVKDLSQFTVNKSKRDGLQSYCYKCHKMNDGEYNRGRLAPAESAVPPSKRCAACGEVSCHRPCVVCHCRHCAQPVMYRMFKLFVPRAWNFHHSSSNRRSICMQVKPSQKFSANHRTPDGLQYECKLCRKLDRKTEAS